MAYFLIKLMLAVGFQPSIYGAGISDGTRIVAVNGNTVTLNKEAR